VLLDSGHYFIIWVKCMEIEELEQHNNINGWLKRRNMFFALSLERKAAPIIPISNSYVVITNTSLNFLLSIHLVSNSM
jgi:hypothetical protein